MPRYFLGRYDSAKNKVGAAQQLAGLHDGSPPRRTHTHTHARARTHTHAQVRARVRAHPLRQMHGSAHLIDVPGTRPHIRYAAHAQHRYTRCGAVQDCRELGVLDVLHERHVLRPYSREQADAGAAVVSHQQPCRTRHPIPRGAVSHAARYPIRKWRQYGGAHARWQVGSHAQLHAACHMTGVRCTRSGRCQRCFARW